MRSLRLGAALPAGAAAGGGAAAYPGSEMPEPESGRGRLLSGGVSILVHALAVAALIFLASQVVEEEELVFELVLPEEVASEEEPAPAPVSISEKLADFAPAPMAAAPQIVNPTVIQNFAQPVTAARIDTAVVAPTVAPTNVDFRSVQVERVSQVASNVTATTAPVVPNYQGPQVRGPIQRVAPVGVVSGPRQVVSSGNTVGRGGPTSLGSGSSVRDGVTSNRDVFGADRGQIANANTNLGKMGERGQGIGGDGRGAGAVSFDECLARPEVQAYMERVKDRMISRWSLPIGATTTEVALSFKLDVAGSAAGIEFRQTGDPAVGESAVDALKAASPFDHMAKPVRCLANRPLVARFKNPTVAAN